MKPADTAAERGAKLARAVHELLRAAGLDPDRDGDLQSTPDRVASLWQREFLSGYAMSPEEILGNPVVGEHDPQAVFVTGLAFHAMCPHHLLPYQGRAHVAYVPDSKLVGFGRIGQLVACFTQRLTLQERATHQVVDALMTHLGARGAGCVMVARQLCLGIPTDRHAANQVITVSFSGELEQRQDLRQRLLNAVDHTDRP